jgi:hypothetical protein
MDTVPDSNSQNTYFILSNFKDTLKSGKNSFIVNPTNLVLPDADITLTAYDVDGNVLSSGIVRPTSAKYNEVTDSGKLYYVNIPATTPSGVGRLEIQSVGLDIGNYTGRIAYFRGNGYKIDKNQRTPLIQSPSPTPLSKVNVLWSANVLIDPTKKTDTEVRFFDSPYIEVTPEIYDCPIYPTSSYFLSSGSFSSIAILPKNNADGDFDYQYDKPIYQLYWKGGAKFSSSMENEQVRIKSPTVKKFTYTNYTNNQIQYEGLLSTDFIAKIDSVVNDTTILLDIPFSTVSELINRSNQDSSYDKNNLVNIKGYGTSNDPLKQTVHHKKNFYILSIDGGEFEIIHKNIVTQLPRAIASGSAFYKKSIIDIDFNNLRVLCGDLNNYKIYGRSLNSPETKTLICEGKIKPTNLISTTNFDNGLYNNPGEFYNPSHVSKYWLVQGSCGFSQTNQVFVDGVTVSHTGNENQSDYVIFKDDTSTGRTATYISYTLLPNSYWYGKSDAFINFASYPSASYFGLDNAPELMPYTYSQENLIDGDIHDSNPIRLKGNSLYEFSINVKPAAENTADSTLYVYFVSGDDKIKIATIDDTFRFGAGQRYKSTFFSDIERYGTIILVPVSGTWSISKLKLSSYQALDYSVDNFKIKIPLKATLNNELFEIEAELYDSACRLAYGEDSYTFVYNQKFLPLKKQIFLDPYGITLISATGGGSPAPYVAMVGPGMGQQSFP